MTGSPETVTESPAESPEKVTEPPTESPEIITVTGRVTRRSDRAADRA